jgi:shikimate dehydrogenase
MIEPLRFAVIGAPVGHSKSPAMHEAAYRALGLPHVYEKLETTSEDLPRRVEDLRAGRYAGLNVTVPHKMRVLALVDELDPSVEATGAANTLVRTSSGGVRAHNTDAPALRDEIAHLVDPASEGGATLLEGKTALVLGSGGAARAAVYALGLLGAGRIIVRARADARDLATSSSSPLSFEPLERPPGSAEALDLAVIVQATPAGMAGSSAPGRVVVDAVSWDTVPRVAVVYDVVYNPPRTPLLERAAVAGLRWESGLGMLVRQGALAFELWLGVAPPRDLMMQALLS